MSSTMISIILLLSTMPSAFGIIVKSLENDFVQETVWQGMGTTVALRWSPGDSKVFAVEKSGRIRLYSSIESGESDFIVTLDMASVVNSYHDRGLLGFAVHPKYPSMPFVFALLTVNRNLNTTDDVPIPNDPSQCPVDLIKAQLTTPPHTRPFCMASGRLYRIRVDQKTYLGAIDQLLISDWCSSSPSHHVDDLVWASDGSLFLSAGDGAPSKGVDFGQPQDQCYDPDGPRLQGSFRSQLDTSLNGKVIRIKPEAVLARRQLALKTDYDIVAKGLRNPYRMALSPASDLFVGDVGSEYWEELNIIPNPLTVKQGLSPPNFGWPCYENLHPAPPIAALNYAECRAITPDQVVFPFYAYAHGVVMKVPDDESNLCTGMGGSPTGILFYEGTMWPKWKDKMIWLDGTKRCVFFFENGDNGRPDHTRLRTLAYTPDTDVDQFGLKPGQFVDITMGVDGQIYLVDIYMSTIERIKYVAGKGRDQGLPVAKATFRSRSVDAMQLTLDASKSLGDIVKYEWDLTGSGVFDTSTTMPFIDHTFTTPGTLSITLRVTNRAGRVSLQFVFNIVVGTSLSLSIALNPPSGSWSHQDTVNMTINAVDNHGMKVPVLSTDILANLQHCSYSPCSNDEVDNSNCHAHTLVISTSLGLSFNQIQHPLPSFVSIKVKVTHPRFPDLSVMASVITRPSVWSISIGTSPPDLEVLPCPRSGGQCSISVMRLGAAVLTVQGMQIMENTMYAFRSWTDSSGNILGHQLTYQVTPTANMSIVANFDPIVIPVSDSIAPPMLQSVLTAPAALIVTWASVSAADYYIITCRIPTETGSTGSIIVQGSSSSSKINLNAKLTPREYDITVTVVSGGRMSSPSASMPGAPARPDPTNTICPGERVLFADVKEVSVPSTAVRTTALTLTFAVLVALIL